MSFMGFIADICFDVYFVFRTDSRRAFVIRWNNGVRKAHSYVVHQLFEDRAQ
jgi:hypothetical protein